MDRILLKHEIPDTFEEGLRRVLQVTKEDLNARLEEERRRKAGRTKPGPKPKTSTSGRAGGNER